MRFLIDENLSPLICTLLIASGHHATHIRDHGTTSASDSQVLTKAAADAFTLITADRPLTKATLAASLRSPMPSSRRWSSYGSFQMSSERRT